MPIATLTNVRFGHGTRLLLDGATLSIEPSEKIGLVGRNGCGKSTLMRLLAGQSKPDAGSVGLQRGCRIGFLTQDPTIEPTDTLREAAARAFSRLSEIRHELDHLYEALSHATGDELDRLLARQSALDHEFDQGGGYAIDHKIDAVLHGLGFADSQFSTLVSKLSGGQRARAGLARLLLEEPDLLLLDEPTNHLDIEGRRWLEDFLADEFLGAVVVVSHDRWLLDRVVSRIVEIHDANIREYPGNYADFTILRRERALTQQRIHDKQQDKISREESYIARYKAGQRARQAKGRATRLERFQRDNLVERPVDFDVMRLELPRAERVGDIVVSAHEVDKAFGPRVLLRDLELTLKPGDRLGVVGANGTGKTTLLRILMGDEKPDKGTLKRSPRLSVGWFRQTHDHIDKTHPVWEYLQLTVPPRANGVRLSEQEARDLAGAFLFSGRAQESLLGSLSGGERARAILAGLVAGAHNLLILDEPSNHLDIPSAERLEQALSLPPDEGGYDGTLILVSHDRALLTATCDQILSLDGDGKWRLFQGTYAEFDAQRIENESAAASPRAASKAATPISLATAPKPKPPATTVTQKPARPRKQSGAPRKTQSAQARDPRNPLSRVELTELESRIQSVNARLTDIDQQLGNPDVYSDRKKTTALLDARSEAERERGNFEEEWLRRANT
ncbi:MAG: ABC transporter ATP-binding protein [Phycisphaerales bacterium]|nr:ABC transporter ATP-binding protein [Phycisphaerales bacterium]